MKKYFYTIQAILLFPIAGITQGNVGIGGTATRAPLEVFGVAGNGNTNAVFGSDGSGISFQQNWPSVGFNQYRVSPNGYGHYMGSGYAAVQYMDPGSGNMALDLTGSAGSKDFPISNELYRGFTIFNNGGVSFGKGFSGGNLTVDYLNYNNTNTANGSIYFYGTQYPSFINSTQVPGMPTQFGPGKDYGITYINDLPSQNVVLGGTSTKVGINTSPLYLTTLSIRHSQNGGGLLLIEEYNYNNWEWYVSNDNPVWIGQKYNGLLIADYNPTSGHHDYVSDRRVKNAIRPLQPVLNKLMQLHPVEYRMNTAKPGSPLTQGFIAQEVKKYFPELVSVINDSSRDKNALPDLHLLNYSQFFTIAIRAIQEQQEEIDALNKEISTLLTSNH